METTNLYLFYGFSAAWLVVLIFILMLVNRGRRIDRELARLRTQLDDRGSR